MVIRRMISRLFCWAIMKKMTKKWDLETSNEEMEPKIRIYRPSWKILTLVKVNGQQLGQRSTVNGLECWRGMWQVGGAKEGEKVQISPEKSNMNSNPRKLQSVERAFWLWTLIGCFIVPLKGKNIWMRCRVIHANLIFWFCGERMGNLTLVLVSTHL